MCGIFGYIGKRKNAAEIVLTGLKTLEYRGYDSWGIAAVAATNPTNVTNPTNPANKIFVKKQTGKIGEGNVKELPESSLAFGHTRWATHGGVTRMNAHPHLDCTGTLAVIHNGIIENYQELKKKLITTKHTFISETDTETAVHLIEEYAKDTLVSKAVQKAFNAMTGLNAFIVLSTKEQRLIAVRNGSPLVVGFGDGENFLASDALAILPYTRQVHFLEDNEMAIMGPNGVMLFNAITGDHIKPRKQLLTWSIEQTEKGKYPFFMLKEIHEQPGLILDIATTGISPAEKLAHAIKTAKNIVFVGCGTAGHAAITATNLFSTIGNIKTHQVIGSEFPYQRALISNHGLVVALSQSGETMDLLESVRLAKKTGSSIFALVNVLGSTLYREADNKILIGAGPENSVASTKAFTSKLAYLILAAYILANKTKKGQELLVAAAKASKEILSPKIVNIIQHIAKQLQSMDDIYVVGRGFFYPIALETALKIKEISYSHAEGLAGGELKHGTLALVTKGTPCITFVPNDETKQSNLSSAMEMKARGGYIIGIGPANHEVFDSYIPVSDVGPASIIPSVIAGQLLAYYLAIARKCDPDKPRNLAKSVTVK